MRRAPRAASAGASLGSLVVALACGGAPSREEAARSRLETARRMARAPLGAGIPEFLTPYDPALGETRTRGDNLAGRRLWHVSGPVQGTLAGVAVDSVQFGFGPGDPEVDWLLDVPLGPEHVLQAVFHSFGSKDCEAVRSFLTERWGPPSTRYGRTWDGITHAVAYGEQGTGVGGPPRCAVWWSHWPPDMPSVGAWEGEIDDEPAPPVIDPAQRAAYLPAWQEAATRTLRGEPEAEVEAFVREQPLDEHHRALLLEQLRPLR